MGGGLSLLKGEDVNAIYRFDKKLGEGSFAIVRRAFLIKAGRKSVQGGPIPDQVAIKTIEKRSVPEKDLPLLKDEVDIMYKINHPNCVGMFEMFDNEQELHLVLEELSGGELFDRVVSKNYFSEQEASDVVKQVASAIQYMHSKGIVHRDLKPENVLYAEDSDESNIKVTDFGLAKYLDGTDAGEFTMKTACGTPGYVAPEVLCGKMYGKQVDLWSLGVILYILLCGYPPFFHENQALLFKQIKAGDFQFASPYWDEISDAAKDVVRGLLQVDPNTRLTTQQLLDMPWIENRGSVNGDATRNLGDHVLQGLKQVQAQQRWQRAKTKIVMINRLTNLKMACQNAAFSKSSSDLNKDQTEAQEASTVDGNSSARVLHTEVAT